MDVGNLAQILSFAAVDWDAFLARLGSHPEEAIAFMSGGSGPLAWLLTQDPPAYVVRKLVQDFRTEIFHRHEIGAATALHQACIFSRSGEVMEAVYNEDRDAVARRNRYDSLPLHCVRHAEVACIFIDAFPQGLAVQNKGGNIPLHLGIYSSPEHLQLLVDEGKRRNVGGENGGGGVFVLNRVNETPLGLICFQTEMSLAWDGPDRIRLLGDDGARNWEKLTILVREASCSSRSFEDSFLMLHAVIDLGCPEKVVCHALRMNPDQLLRRDGSGKLPLHVAAERFETPARVVQWLVNPDFGFPGGAGTADGRGRLPLHIATANGRGYDDGLEHLLLAEPRALETRDVCTGLYPFMLVPMDGEEATVVDTAYRLLRECPSVLLTFN